METKLVFKTTDSIELTHLKSILKNHGINYFVKNEKTQNLLSSTSLVSGYDVIAGNYLVYVSEEEIEKVEDILQRLNSGEDFEHSTIQSLPDEEEFIEHMTKENFEMSTTEEDRQDLLRLLFLSILSYSSVLAVYSIKIQNKLRGKFKVTRTILLFIQIPLFLLGLKALFNTGLSRDFVVIINIILLCILVAFKGVRYIVYKKIVIGIILILPILLICGGVLVLGFIY